MVQKVDKKRAADHIGLLPIAQGRIFRNGYESGFESGVISEASFE